MNTGIGNVHANKIKSNLTCHVYKIVSEFFYLQ